jgi:hypothetical protein
MSAILLLSGGVKQTLAIAAAPCWSSSGSRQRSGRLAKKVLFYVSPNGYWIRILV